MSKMINCKICGKEIAKNAKVCPNCGAKRKRKWWLIIAIVLVCALIGGLASGGEDEPTKIDDNDTASPSDIGSTSDVSKPDVEQPTRFHKGDVVELRGVSATLTDVIETTGSNNSFFTPEAGNVYVICEFEIVNNSTSELAVSSLLNFTAYCDDYACSLSIGALTAVEGKTQLDGSVAVGKKMKGIVGYEVPANWKEMEIRFTPNVWSGNDIVFVASK